MASEFTNTSMTNIIPPRCPTHPESQMVLNFYARPGGPPGNNWVCTTCFEERNSITKGSLKYAKTRWPEGAEL